MQVIEEAAKQAVGKPAVRKAWRKASSIAVWAEVGEAVVKDLQVFHLLD